MNRAQEFLAQYHWKGRVDDAPVKPENETRAARFIRTYLSEEKPHDAPSLKPPKKWWREKSFEIKNSNPDYNQDQVDRVLGDIWYNQLTNAQRKKIRSQEGKEYGLASNK